MKTYFLSLISAVLILFSGIVSAESVIVKETTTWKDVPIKVDTTTNTYTVVGTMPDASVTEYYYSYPGYRCISEKRDIAGINVLSFNASVSGGQTIYCYPE